MALVVFTGGARSGKSSSAQELARRRALDGASVVTVVFGLTGDDPEMADRVERHRLARPQEFEVIEARDSSAWFDLVGPESLLLLDCMGTLVGMVMNEEWPSERQGGDLIDAAGDLSPGYAAAVEARAIGLVSALCVRQGDTIVVTNEVGGGVVPAYGSGRLFRDVLGRANRQLVNRADRAYLAVCGRLVDLDVAATSPRWPED